MTQLRLIIAGVLLLVLAGMGTAIYKYRADAASLKAQLIVAEINAKVLGAANAALAKELDTQIERNRISDETSAKLAINLSGIRDKLTDATEELARLRASDATVDDFLKLDVPPAVQRMLDR